MAKIEIRKCQKCGLNVDKDDAIFYKKRYHHKECYHERKMGEADEDKRQDLIVYIEKIYGKGSINGVVVKQIKNFKESGYTYAGMKLTLWYFYEIKENMIKSEGIGIIPYVYSEAKQYYIKTIEARKHMDKLKEGGITALTTQRTVKVKPKEVDIQKKQKIDISQL